MPKDLSVRDIPAIIPRDWSYAGRNMVLKPGPVTRLHIHVLYYQILCWTGIRPVNRKIVKYVHILLGFSLSVKAAPHECVIRTSQL